MWDASDAAAAEPVRERARSRGKASPPESMIRRSGYHFVEKDYAAQRHSERGSIQSEAIRSKSAFGAVSRRYERAVRRRRSDNPVPLIIAAVIGMALGLAATALVPSLR
jgi:hypothetical protein